MIGYTVRVEALFYNIVNQAYLFVERGKSTTIGTSCLLVWMLKSTFGFLICVSKENPPITQKGKPIHFDFPISSAKQFGMIDLVVRRCAALE